MIGIYWLVDIALVIGDVVLAGLIARNYYSIGFTKIGKLLLYLSIIFLVQGIAMLIAYSKWAMMGYDETIALPSLVITASSLIGMAFLYYISKM
ncbi:hypothetical protein GCM10007981_14660 [Thermocladium modestius]|uniref:Uncharacterized protein n=1 Tax=Thermocladium modestius TaxID=62609 RepID=A0A830GWG7_9CREN|nr:hypothetical protein [Thermocladium modestius]GGP21717.1 hypothetical protein GCM10007981_14660 [Thermocladium modestius]